MRGVRGGQLGGGCCCCWVDGGGFDLLVCLLGFDLGGILMISRLNLRPSHSQLVRFAFH